MEKQFKRLIFFSKVPMKGVFAHSDKFQIYPLNVPEMPKSEKATHFPNVLEFWLSPNETNPNLDDVDDEEYLTELLNPIKKKESEILALLSIFSNHHFFSYDPRIGSYILELDLITNPNDVTSTWAQQFYHFKGFYDFGQITSFSNVVIEPMKISNDEHVKYFVSNPNLDFNSTLSIVLPNKINLSFESYYRFVSKSENPTLQNAIHHIYNSIELFAKKPTLSMVSTFIGIESMIEFEYKDAKKEHCNSCSQLKHKISARFKEFLLKYVGNSDSNKRKFNAYYSKRCKIVHSGDLLEHEKLFPNFETEKLKDKVLKMEILQLGRIALGNWIYVNGSE